MLIEIFNYAHGSLQNEKTDFLLKAASQLFSSSSQTPRQPGGNHIWGHFESVVNYMLATFHMCRSEQRRDQLKNATTKDTMRAYATLERLFFCIEIHISEEITVDWLDIVPRRCADLKWHITHYSRP